MRVDKLNLERVFDRTERLEAPLFQRPYVWKLEPNWMALWESIQMVAERHLDGKLAHPHFLGTIVLDQIKTGLGQLHVRQIIDGQQRLTTLQLSLAAARDLCTRLNEHRYAKAFEKLTVNDVPLSDNPDDAFKVWPTNADQDDFRTVMTARSPAVVKKLDHADKSDDWLIPDAYLYFYETFDDWLGPAGTEEFQRRLEVLYGTMREDLHVVVIDLEATDDAQEIFETLNSLGTPLLPADLVKNFLFHRAGHERENTRQLYEACWQKFDSDKGYWRKEVRQGRLKRPRLDLFLNHFLTLQRRDETIIAQLFSAYRDLVEEANGLRAADHMKRFSEYADVYEGFEQFPAESREGLFFYRLSELDTTTVFPLLLEVVKRYGTDDKDALREIMGDLESFFVRRTVCQLTAKSYNKFVVDLLKELHDANDYSPGLIRAFLLRSQADTTRWPNDEEFRTAWMTVPFYKRLKKKTRMILEALELALYTGKTEKVMIDSKLTIEHLMPREWGRHWPLTAAENTPEGREESDRREGLLHTLGNLTLLTKELNPSVSNGAWEKKLEAILKHSALNLNRTLPKQWNEDGIRHRAETLFDIALKVWPRPEPVVSSTS
ncbi:MAG TPA: DUF262 domain-containing protein [Vicinamibacterales bacterium]|nr:DUF262 domain-containing protein [Vicinamibacterales bacterium]